MSKFVVDEKNNETCVNNFIKLPVALLELELLLFLYSFYTGLLEYLGKKTQAKNVEIRRIGCLTN